MRLPAFEFATLFLAFSMFSLDGLLGFVLFSSSVTCFVKQKLRNFQRKKKLAQLGGVGGGGCLRSSDIYTKSRGFALFLFVYLFFASPRRVARDFCYVCKCV